MSELIHLLSLGGGVQSSTMALQAAHGLITPMPTAAIFADTQGEPAAVYKWLDWLERQLPFPVVRVTKGSLRDASLQVIRSRRSGLLYLKRLIPAYVAKPDGTRGMMGRTCTYDYKVAVIIREARRFCDWKRGEKRLLVSMWIGISTDEAHRMKPSRERWIENRWPLIDEGLSRQGCLDWMAKMGYPQPPRSACTFCPFHSDEEWLRLKGGDPAEWQAIVDYERALQDGARRQEAMKGMPFLHNSCQPIDKVAFDEGLPERHQVSQFGNECEGLCGV